MRAGVSLRYETTAGAALPVLVTLDRVVQSGDTLVRMDAVLSGTLNYLLDNYKGEGWDALVEDARLKGYTEPDPNIDLSGKDVLRKILILSRQAGLPLEEAQVSLEPIPADIAERYAAASAAGHKLRYVASVDAEGHAVVGLQEVGPDSPLYGLRGHRQRHPHHHRRLSLAHAHPGRGRRHPPDCRRPPERHMLSVYSYRVAIRPRRFPEVGG